ncbi:hypothetical protein KI387_037646, partial [Taxus chinensis]
INVMGFQHGITLASLLSISLLLFPASVYGQYGGWQSAHATFYGGSDASGTM